MRTASSAIATCRLFASASKYTPTVRIPIRRAVVITRQAISPRLAMSILLNMTIGGNCKQLADDACKEAHELGQEPDRKHQQHNDNAERDQRISEDEPHQ